MTPEQIWNDALLIIQRQMTQATFSTMFCHSELVSTNGVYIIKTHPIAKDWLEHRLVGIVARALTAIVGEPVTPEQLQFVTNGASSEPITETPLRVRDRRRGKRYFIDREFIFDGFAAILGPFATALYNVLSAHADNDAQDAHLYYSTLARESGMSRRQAIKTMSLLEQHHVVEIIREADGVRANDFYLLDVSEWIL